ncbi:O-antigen ligase family protein [Novosphingobium clariflavum]|uniref:O-antigen ligase family protein n=1 Tax=Novosphingobium clariflavum TaxID=2029884 RepID=A0ABV6S8A1_9SPHN|nr:O-antigen ligase family protein [Novosphingobium clariflavum]
MTGGVMEVRRRTLAAARRSEGRYGPQGGRRSALAVWLARRDVQDGGLAGLIVLARIPANFGMPGALAFLLLATFYAVLRPEQVRAVFTRCWMFLVIPLFALASVGWSAFPMVTLRAAVQMALTIMAGLLLSQSSRPRVVVAGLFVAYAVYTLLTLALVPLRPIENGQSLALYGLGGEVKNYFSDTASTASLLALTMAALFAEQRAPLRMMLALGVTGLCVWTTVRANSAGGLAALAVSGALLVVLLLLRERSRGVKLAFVCMVVLWLIGILCFFDTILAHVQQMSEKDSGLTGRGYLWFRAHFIIAERPLLGYGYAAFWHAENPDAVGLWHHFDLRQESTGFSFHNTFLQTIVETGLVGLAVLLATWLAGCLALLRRFVLTASLPTCFWLAYMALQLTKTPVELIRPTGLVAPTILLGIALGFGCFPVGRDQAIALRVRRGPQSSASG